MEDKLRKQVDRGVQARLAKEQIKPFEDEYLASLVKSWAGEKDPTERDAIWQRHNALAGFNKMLTRVISDGAEAQRRITEMNEENNV